MMRLPDGRLAPVAFNGPGMDQGNGVTTWPVTGAPVASPPVAQARPAVPNMGPPQSPDEGALPVIQASKATAPVLDSRYGWGDALADIALPALATVATGGFGLPAALAYGMGKARKGWRDARDPLQMAQTQAAIAKAQFEAQNPAPRDSNPSMVQEYQFAVSQGYEGNYTDFLEDYKRSDRTPSSVLEAEAQAAADRGEGGADLVGMAARTAGATETAKTRSKLSEEGYNATVELIPSINRSYNSLVEIRELIANGPETGPASEWLALIDPELQELRALTSGQALDALQAAKAGGATFGSMQIAEWQMLANTVAQLGNNKQANLRIIDRLIKKIEGQQSELYDQIENWGSGTRRPVPSRTERPAPETGEIPGDASLPQRPEGWDKY